MDVVVAAGGVTGAVTTAGGGLGTGVVAFLVADVLLEFVFAEAVLLLVESAFLSEFDAVVDAAAGLVTVEVEAVAAFLAELVLTAVVVLADPDVDDEVFAGASASAEVVTDVPSAAGVTAAVDFFFL